MRTKVKCPACFDAGKYKCMYCKGKGKRWAWDLSKYEFCSRCMATGSINCYTCNGKGSIEESQANIYKAGTKKQNREFYKEIFVKGFAFLVWMFGTSYYFLTLAPKYGKYLDPIPGSFLIIYFILLIFCSKLLQWFLKQFDINL